MRKALLTLLAGTLLGSALFAQEASSGNDEAVFELSPFTVTAEETSGYLATSTLAGTRLNTELKEVGAAVSVYTEDFLQDVDATSVEELLTYTTSTEGGGLQGNYAGYDSGNTDNARDDPSGVNRVRALSNATRTRDFFATDIPSDTYNFTTLTVSRGPNAILAGIGDAGGIIDSAMRQANFKNAGQVKLRFGSNNSHREELHYNQVIIDDRLAVRLDALNEKRIFSQDPAYEKDQRVYMAAKWNIREANPRSFLGRTTMRANVELGSIEGIPVDPLPPILNTASWFEGIDSRDGIPFAYPKWYIDGAQRRLYAADGTFIGGNTVATAANNTDVIQGFPFYRQWALMFSDPNSSTPSIGIADPAFAAVQGVMGTIPVDAKSGAPGGFYRASGDRNRDRFGFVRTRLTNRDVFDFYNHLISGQFDFRRQSFDATDVRLEQLFMGGNAGIELAYNMQHFERGRDFPLAGGGEDGIYIDTTKYFPVRTDAFNTTPKGPIASQLIENPNFGRPFVIGRDVFRDQRNSSKRESYQATAFLKHDFTASDSKWARWLGRQTLTGLLFNTDWDRYNRTYISTWDIDGELSLIDSTGNQPGSFPAQVNALFYIGPSMVDVATEDQMRLTPITSGRPQPGETYTLRVWDNAQGKFITGTSSAKRVLPVPRDQSQQVKSSALALQSHWLNGHLITLVGWRRDASDAFSSIDPPMLPDGNADMTQFYMVPAVSETAETWTKSVVFNIPNKWTAGLDLRVFWNESGNFNPVGARRNQFNEELGQPSSSSEEYGFGLVLLDGKLDIRVNRFTTQIKDAAIGNVGNVYSYVSNLIDRMLAARDLGLNPADEGYDYSGFQDFEDVAKAFYETIPTDLKDNIGPQYNFNPRFVDNAGVLDWEPDTIENKVSVSDVVATGLEIEAVYNPTRNWRISLSLAKNEAVKADVAAAELEYAAAWRQNLETMYDGALLRGARNPGSESTPFWPQYQNEHLRSAQTAAALSGTVSPEIREWRANIVTNYQFTDGPLEGVSIGGTLRWQDEIGIGYPYIRDENNNNVADIANPWYGPDSLQVDLSLSYKTDLKAFGQDIKWTIALNIANLIGEDQLIPVTANADGSYGVVRIPPERTWFITNTFAF